MIRLYTDFPLSGDNKVSLSEKQTHYLYHVMRLKAGDEVALFNANHGEWICRIDVLSKKGAHVVPARQTRAAQIEEGPVLAPALIKKDHFDLVLQKATELGVSKIIPILAERSVMSVLNLDRARLIVTEAAEQCERLTVPVVVPPMRVVDLIKTLSPHEKLVYLSERGRTQGALLRQDKKVFAVGPEGGWTPMELSLFSGQKGAVSLNLGDRILRAETASIAVLAADAFDIFCQKVE